MAKVFRLTARDLDSLDKLRVRLAKKSLKHIAKMDRQYSRDFMKAQNARKASDG